MLIHLLSQDGILALIARTHSRFNSGVPKRTAGRRSWPETARRSTSSPSAARRSTSTASRSAAGSRTWRASPSMSAAARPTSRSARPGSACARPSITRVGDEHMGRFIKEELAREGVDTRGVATDPERLTALVILGIRDQHSFPLIFYRENCADAALERGRHRRGADPRAPAPSWSPAPISAGPISTPPRARRCGWRGRTAAKVGARHRLPAGALGPDRPRARRGALRRLRGVTAHLQTILPDCDLIVGTEEEVHIAGGTTDTLARCRRSASWRPRRSSSSSAGPWAASRFPGPIPADLEEGVKGPGFPVEVYNVLGAGDGFMSGLPARLAARPAAGGMLPPRQRLRRLRGLAPRLRARLSRAGPSSQTFLERGSPSGRCARTRGSSSSTGRPRAPAGLAAGAGLRLRPPLPARGDGGPGRRQPRATSRTSRSWRLPAARRACRRPARLRRSDRRPLRRGRAGRGRRHRVPGSGAPIELPGSRPLRFDGALDPGIALARVADRPVRQVPRLLPPRRPGRRSRRSRSGRC